jgi:hypothetical protein
VHGVAPVALGTSIENQYLHFACVLSLTCSSLQR